MGAEDGPLRSSRFRLARDRFCAGQGQDAPGWSLRARRRLDARHEQRICRLKPVCMRRCWRRTGTETSPKPSSMAKEACARARGGSWPVLLQPARRFAQLAESAHDPELASSHCFGRKIAAEIPRGEVCGVLARSAACLRLKLPTRHVSPTLQPAQAAGNRRAGRSTANPARPGLESRLHLLLLFRLALRRVIASGPSVGLAHIRALLGRPVPTAARYNDRYGTCPWC